MSTPKERPERTRHPTLWTVEAVRWEFREHETEYDRLLAKKREKGPGVQLGQQIAAVDVEDRELDVAVARHFLDRFAEEAAGRMSLEIHVYPPGKDLHDESVYQVTGEVLEQALQLGLEGTSRPRSSARPGTAPPYHEHPSANPRHGRFILKVEGNDVTWIGLLDPLRPPRKRK